MSITDLKHINENGIDYHLITNKYREFFFPVLMIAMAKYLTTFVDSVLVSAFLGVDRMPAVNLCFPVVCFISLFHGSEYNTFLLWKDRYPHLYASAYTSTYGKSFQ